MFDIQLPPVLQATPEDDAELRAAIGQTTEILVSLLGSVIPASYTPFLDRVLLYPLPEPPRSRLVDLPLSKEAPLRALVVRLGASGVAGRVLEYEPGCSIEPGDVVIFSRHSGQVVRFGDVELRLIKAADILAAFNPEPRGAV